MVVEDTCCLCNREKGKFFGSPLTEIDVQILAAFLKKSFSGFDSLIADKIARFCQTHSLIRYKGADSLEILTSVHAQTVVGNEHLSWGYVHEICISVANGGSGCRYFGIVDDNNFDLMKNLQYGGRKHRIATWDGDCNAVYYQDVVGQGNRRKDVAFGFANRCQLKMTIDMTNEQEEEVNIMFDIHSASKGKQSFLYTVKDAGAKIYPCVGFGGGSFREYTQCSYVRRGGNKWMLK